VPRVLLELSGTTKWWVLFLSLDWEVLSVMVASVDQYEDFRAPLGEEDSPCH
jgi:hypothetical protein